MFAEITYETGGQACSLLNGPTARVQVAVALAATLGLASAALGYGAQWLQGGVPAGAGEAAAEASSVTATCCCRGLVLIRIQEHRCCVASCYR